jgi:hypothetical protein
VLTFGYARNSPFPLFIFDDGDDLGMVGVVLRVALGCCGDNYIRNTSWKLRDGRSR